MEIGEFGVGRPDFGGRWPRGEALGQKKRVMGLGEAQDAGWQAPCPADGYGDDGQEPASGWKDAGDAPGEHERCAPCIQPPATVHWNPKQEKKGNR